MWEKKQVSEIAFGLLICCERSYMGHPIPATPILHHLALNVALYFG